MRISGIYKIESPSGKVYIGQSVNVKKRFNNYRCLDCKQQPTLYNSLIKYGVENHKFDVIAYVNGIDALNQSEIAYINLYRRMGYSMLNLKDGGLNAPFPEHAKKILSELRKGKKRPELSGVNNPYYGKKHSDEIKAIMSAKGKFNKLGAKNGRARAIYQYDLNGNLIKEWLTITDASKELNIFRQSISDCLNGRNKTSGGFIWKYKL